MAIRNSCFLSFRGGKGNLAAGILDLFAKALENELELQVDAGLYRYTQQMVAGDFIDPSIAKELVASACMVVLFTGKYFSKTNTYCTREYLAMSRLEESRLKELQNDGQPNHGLIIPVILRNPERFPNLLKQRFWLDFTEFAEDDKGITKPKKFFSDIRKIAAYIASRYYELEGVVSDDETLDWPDEQAAHKFLAEVQSSLSKTRKQKKD
ncbi:MAG TPA: toll/interleukin-1 receptor domain-containing protein [Pyrinomonadaceae bacterium]|nr:toll/interleukin-1 receptor domain-containing protein [Pyrinomonadaceae bacterium]